MLSVVRDLLGVQVVRELLVVQEPLGVHVVHELCVAHVCTNC